MWGGREGEEGETHVNNAMQVMLKGQQIGQRTYNLIINYFVWNLLIFDSSKKFWINQNII